MGKYLKKDGHTSMPAGIGIGVLGSCVLTAAGAAIIAALVSGEKISQEAMGGAAVCIQFVSSALGAALSDLLLGRKKMQAALITGACYFALLMSLTAMFFGGQYRGVGLGALAVFLGALLPPVLSVWGRKGSKRVNIKKAYR